MAQHRNLQTDYLHQFLWTLLATILHPGSQHAHQDSRTHGQAVLPLRLSHSRQLAEVNLQRLGASHMSIAKALLWRCPLDSLLRERSFWPLFPERAPFSKRCSAGNTSRSSS